MELLFKREQSVGAFNRVNFRLWGKLEISEDEQALVDRYRFAESLLIRGDDFLLFRRAIMIGIATYIVVAALLAALESGVPMVILGGLLAGGVAGYLYMNEKRETVFVKDMLHGRNFTCKSVVELAKKEAWLEGACAVFRQVMESAKHWDGVERHTIDPLPKDEAKELILRAF